MKYTGNLSDCHNFHSYSFDELQLDLTPLRDISHFPTLPFATYGSFSYRVICHMCQLALSLQSRYILTWSICAQSIYSVRLPPYVVPPSMPINHSAYDALRLAYGSRYRCLLIPQSNGVVHRSRPVPVSQQHPDCNIICNLLQSSHFSHWEYELAVC